MNQGDVSSLSHGLLWVQISQSGPLFTDTMASTLCPARAITLSKVSTWGLFCLEGGQSFSPQSMLEVPMRSAGEGMAPVQPSTSDGRRGRLGDGRLGDKFPSCLFPMLGWCWGISTQEFPNCVADAHSGNWCDHTSFSCFLSFPASPPHFPSSISSDHLLNKEHGLESLPQGLFLGELKSIQAILYFFLLPILLTSTCLTSVGVKKS